jgi:hypothetical protein
MRRVAISLVLICAACNEKEATTAEAAEESGTDTGAIERCEDQLTQSACNGLQATDPEGEDWECAWVDVQTYTATCEAGPTDSRCIKLVYIGAGCEGGEIPTCEEGGPNVYIRDAGEAGFELFRLAACEHQPEHWDLCTWNEGGEIHPDAACACGC